LPRRAPPDAAPYASFFHCPVRFEQETATLVFPAQLMRRPIAGAHPLVRNAAGRRIQQLETFIPSAVTSEVQRYVRSAAAQKRIGRHPVAQTLAIDKRTLTRRLRAEATSFKVVVNQTRFSMAKQLLADTNLSLTDIAAALDFSEAAAFTHAFRRWAGTTPSAWRRDQRRD
jgi:AraC-like DNA-binding protein